MAKQNIINESEKEEYCEYIYNELILKAKDVIIKCQSYTSLLKVKLPISCYTNFRDAIFHFYKMYTCVMDVDIYNQAFAIKEHLSRAQTDAINNMIAFFSKIIEIMLKQESEKLERQLREYLHYLRSYQLKKRINGMMIFDKNSPLLSTDIDEALVKINDFLLFIQENDLTGKMVEIINVIFKSAEMEKPIIH